MTTEATTNHQPDPNASEQIVIPIDEARSARATSTDERPAYRQTLAKRPGLSVLLLGLKAGQLVPKHQAAAATTVHVLEGEVGLCVEGIDRTVPAGSLLVLNPGARHNLTAQADSTVLLTLATEA